MIDVYVKCPAITVAGFLKVPLSRIVYLYKVLTYIQNRKHLPAKGFMRNSASARVLIFRNMTNAYGTFCRLSGADGLSVASRVLWRSQIFLVLYEGRKGLFLLLLPKLATALLFYSFTGLVYTQVYGYFGCKELSLKNSQGYSVFETAL